MTLLAHAPPALGCGIDGHEPSCLCDVVLDGLVPINYALRDLWYADQLDVAEPHTSADLANFADTLLSAYDTWRVIADHSPREAMHQLLSDGHSIVDMPALMGVSWDEVVAAMTHNIGEPARWTQADWITVESVLRDEARSMSSRELGLRLGVHYQTASHLCSVYGVRLNVSVNDRLRAMREHLLDGETPTEAVLSLTSDGFDVSYNQLYQMRRKMIDRGELERGLPPSPLRVVAC